MQTMLMVALAFQFVPGGVAEQVQPARWHLEPIHVIGSFDDGPTAFEYIIHAMIAPNGDTYVVDADARRIAVFDGDGAFVRDIGRRGSGPAEFRLISSAGLNGDTLWAFDGPQGKIVRFTPVGEFVRSERTDTRGGPLLPLAVGPARLLAVSMTSLATDSAAVVISAGIHTDTIISIHRPSTRMRIAIGSVDATLQHEFHDGELIATNSDGTSVYVVQRSALNGAESALFRVIRFDSIGVHAGARSYRYERARINDAQVTSVVDRIVWRFTQLPMLRGRDAAVRDAVIAALPVPRFAPPVWSAVAADDGFLWIERARRPDGSHWLVLDAGGDVVARTVLPSRVALSSVRGDRACGIDQTGSGYPRVICYRIHR